MSGPVMVRHEGMDWPLETFISSHHMVRVDPFALPSLDGDVRVLTVDGEGRVLPDRRWREVSIRDVVAFSLLDLPEHVEACYFCGTSPDEDVICDDCADGEYY